MSFSLTCFILILLTINFRRFNFQNNDGILNSDSISGDCETLCFCEDETIFEIDEYTIFKRIDGIIIIFNNESIVEIQNVTVESPGKTILLKDNQFNSSYINVENLISDEKYSITVYFNYTENGEETFETCTAVEKPNQPIEFKYVLKDEEIELSWTIPDNVKSPDKINYKIKYKNYNDELNESNAINDTNYNIVKKDGISRYTFHLSAYYHQDGKEIQGEEITLQLPGTPDEAENIEFETLNSKSIRVKWSEPTTDVGIQRFVIEIYLSERCVDQIGSIKGEKTTEEFTIDFEDLSANSCYFFKIYSETDFAKTPGHFTRIVKTFAEDVKDNDSSPVGAIIGGVFSVLFVLGLIALLLFARRRKLGPFKNKTANPERELEEREYADGSSIRISPTSTTVGEEYDDGSSNPRCRVDTRVESGYENGAYQREVQSKSLINVSEIKNIVSGLKYAELKEDLKKKDHANKKSNESTQIKLPITDAGFSKLRVKTISEKFRVSKSVEYMLSNSPFFKKEEVKDIFWNEIWDKKIQIIVMLTEEQEHGTIYCSPYLLKSGEIYESNTTESNEAQHSKLTVCLDYSTENEHFIERIFEAKSGTKKRVICHLQIKGWPIAAFPKKGAIIALNKKVRTVSEKLEYSSSPIFVHCSTKFNRTEVYLTIDYCIDCITGKAQNIDINSFIVKLRTIIPNGIKNDEQYVYIYEILAEYLKSKPLPTIPTNEPTVNPRLQASDSSACDNGEYVQP